MSRVYLTKVENRGTYQNRVISNFIPSENNVLEMSFASVVSKS